MAASEVGSTATTPAGKMTHSHSLPAAVDAVSLPDASASSAAAADAKQRSGKMLFVTVTMLDDIQVTFHVQHKALGQELFELVCKQLSLLEVDYFGLEYEDSNRTKYWLDLEKPMNRQLGLSMVDCSVQFGVKFYTPDPAQLEEEYTRYLFCLQIKKDLMSGTLQCNENTAAIMASYIVQADCGDFVADDYPDHLYLASYKFVPHQNEELERRIMEHHKRHVGQSPAEADLNLLETVRRCELYGIRMHPAKDHEGVPLNLAVAHMGVLVFQNFTKINTFSWAKVRKLSFKRKRFLIKLHPEGYGYYKDTVEFYFESRNECKNFWKKCVEHHGFFRCNTVKKLPRQKTRVLSRGSSFRYCGRTQKQIVDYVRENFIKRQPFQRSQSFRHSSSAHSGLGHVQNSRSSQPLYAVGDHSVGTPASHSCGSMVLNDDQSDSTEAVGTSSPSLVRGETTIASATADVHSESMASDELTNSLSSSPKRSSFDAAAKTTHPVTNGKIAADEQQQQPPPPPPPPTATVNKGGENNDTNSGFGRSRNPLFNQSSTDSPVSRGSSSAKDRADDSVSQDSYQLLDSDVHIQSNPTVTNSSCDGEHAENEQGKGMTRFEGDPCGINSDDCQMNVFCKRTSDLSRFNDEDHVFIPPMTTPCPPKPPLRNSEAKGVPSAILKTCTDHPKMTQSSPTLYARSRLRSDESPSRMRSASGGFSPKSPQSLDFVHLSSLPGRHSYSSKDDSLNGCGSFEHQIVEHLQRRRRDRESSSASSLASSTSTQSSRDSGPVATTLEPLRIVEDGDEKVVGAAPFHGTASSTVVEMPRKRFAEMVSNEDNDEWEKLAPTFPPPPPPPLHDVSPPVEKVESIHEARSKFLANTISNNNSSANDGRLLRIHSFEEASSDHSCSGSGVCGDTDNDTTVTVEESSDTGEQTTIIDNYVGRSVTITELEFDDVDVIRRDEPKAVVEAYTAFGEEEDDDDEGEDQDHDERHCVDQEVTVSIHDDTVNGETESLPREADLDDDDYEDLEPCPPLMDDTLLLYPVRTLSRISERSTSEQSESKEDSTPSHESRPSDDRHPSVGELPSDYSVSDDNPDNVLSSNDSDCSPSRGRAPGTGSGLGLSPIRSFETVATIEPEFIRAPVPFENRYDAVSDLDGEGSQVETYYMEIDSVQKERLERGEVVFYKAPYEPVGLGEESSSADNDTLCEEHSFLEAVDFLSDFSPDDNLREGGGVAAAAGSSASTPAPSEAHKELYEGLGVCIPARSPTSPLKTPEPCSTRIRHRISMELQVSKGVFSENKPPGATVTRLNGQEEEIVATTNDLLNNDFQVTQSLISNEDSRFTSPCHTDDNAKDVTTRSNGNQHRKSEDAEVDLRRKRYPTDKAYYIAKEILNTERTYKKDLDVIALWFMEVTKDEEFLPAEIVNHLYGVVEQMYRFNSSFLKEVEQRLATWEGRSNAHLKGDYQKIGDILLNNMNMLDFYRDYLDSYPSMLERLDCAYQRNHKLEQVYREFEMHKACYLPLNNFFLKPVHHLMHIEHLLQRLIQHYGTDHPDCSDCVNALNKLREVTVQMANPLKRCENYVKLIELQRDIIGIDNLVLSGREFVREGCLQKVSKKGLQQRMFFLFSDVLLYASRTTTALQFKVHSQLPIRDMVVEICEPRLGASNCFVIDCNSKSITVSASSPDEREKWMEDLTRVAETFKDYQFDNYLYSSLRSCGSSASSDEILDKNDIRSEEELQSPTRPTDKSTQQRSNTTVHVCWHRNTSVSMKDHTRAIENQLSGYLLRKFKNSDGWQKLWVVFTNFCLFFYKTFLDEFPLASLPLLGYSVTVPSESDNINKEYVFKLQFKNHVYFFRAESEYSYGRWMDVICSATQHSGRIRLFSRTESVSLP